MAVKQELILAVSSNNHLAHMNAHVAIYESSVLKSKNNTHTWLELDHLSSYCFFKTDSDMARDIIWGNRFLLEENESYRQLLPYYTIVKTINGVKCAYAYYRTNKVGEPKLANRVSVGLGGHIEYEDYVFDEEMQGVDLLQIIINNARREINEEVKFTVEKTPYNNFTMPSPFTIEQMDLVPTTVLASSFDTVGKMHLMLNAVIDLDETYYTEKFGDVSIDVNESELLQIGFVPVEELLDSDKYSLEDWSQFVLSEIIKK